MRYFIFMFSVWSLVSCGSSGSNDTSNNANRTIVGDNALLYSEMNEVSNSLFNTPESTSYILDSNGIKITGSFETSNPSPDYYIFYTDTSTGVDIQVFLNGLPVDLLSSEIGTSLDAFEDDGLSSLNGLNNARNAWVAPASFFVIDVFAFNAAGKTYTIQMKSAQ